jgi:hypothetical protein
MKKQWRCAQSNYDHYTNITELRFIKGKGDIAPGSALFLLIGNKSKKFKVGEMYALGYE